jgi:hypothetical protein
VVKGGRRRLYLDLPDNAVVVCVDEKSSVRTLKRTRPILPMRSASPDGRPGSYAPHQVTCRFTALEMASGQINDACYTGTATRSSCVPQESCRHLARVSNWTSSTTSTQPTNIPEGSA